MWSTSTPRSPGVPAAVIEPASGRLKNGPDTVGEVGAGAGGSPRLVPSAPASGGSGRLRATWQGSKGEAVAFGMPVSGQLGEFANGIRPFSRRTELAEGSFTARNLGQIAIKVTTERHYGADAPAAGAARVQD